MKPSKSSCWFCPYSRLPPGRRGLKPLRTVTTSGHFASPSPRKAWIETGACGGARTDGRSPSPRKAWIETLYEADVGVFGFRRLPPGRRGLKPLRAKMILLLAKSPSPRKAWIETRRSCIGFSKFFASPSPRKAWIETTAVTIDRVVISSRLPPGRRGLKHK